MKKINKEDMLTRGQKITLYVMIIVVFLAVILQLLIRTWYSPDIRYELGSYFELKDQAVVSCVLHNYGHETAKSVRISTNFKSNIIDLQVSPFTKYTFLNGALGKQRLVIEIERIVPGDQITIFYATEKSQQETFLEKIEYADNIAKTGKPSLFPLSGAVVLYIALTFILVKSRKLPFFKRFLAGDFDKHYENIDTVVKLAYDLKQKSAKKEELVIMVEKKFKDTYFRKNTLKKIAESVFDNIDLEPEKEDNLPF